MLFPKVFHRLKLKLVNVIGDSITPKWMFLAEQSLIKTSASHSSRTSFQRRYLLISLCLPHLIVLLRECRVGEHLIHHRQHLLRMPPQHIKRQGTLQHLAAGFTHNTPEINKLRQLRRRHPPCGHAVLLARRRCTERLWLIGRARFKEPVDLNQVGTLRRKKNYPSVGGNTLRPQGLYVGHPNHQNNTVSFTFICRAVR